MTAASWSLILRIRLCVPAIMNPSTLAWKATGARMTVSSTTTAGTRNHGFGLRLGIQVDGLLDVRDPHIRIQSRK